MPQMSPMNWMMLMFMFTMILIMCISLMYFIYLPNNKLLTNIKNQTKLPKFLTWKW
uniref:ATP8 protein n=1 Tax=Cephus pygmeus TaxID=222802 RepID=A0A0B5EE59_9HYME|nr:ATP synthase F0 subunit 8 [Cephus pygmeus]